MTQNKRIFVNIIATYGRSLYALIIGLLCGRWALMALGQTDYGLSGLIGGMTAFVAFFNSLLAASVGRFYAVSVGAAKKDGTRAGLEESTKWFNTAFSIHTVIPFVLLLIGYPIGEWAVRNFLTIPSDRITDCVWVWRFTCFSCFISMVNVPFTAMYGAKQEIAELTIYSFITSTLNVGMLYYMITHPGVWLFRYALWGCMLSVVPAVIMTIRAVCKYPELRIRVAYLWNKSRIKEVAVFAFARFWTAISDIFSQQGSAVLINKYLGPNFNASMAIGNTVASQATTLSTSLTGAFWPVIANKVGEEKLDEARKFAFTTCKLSSLLVMIFAVPMILEADELMILWLKTPPDFVSLICRTILVGHVIASLTEGYWMPIMAEGTYMSRYSWIIGWSGFTWFALVWIFLGLGFGVYGFCIALITAKLITMSIRLFLGRTMAGLSAKYWISHIAVPVALVGAISFGCAYPIRFVMEPSFLRVVVTSFISISAYIACCWIFACTDSEKEMLLSRAKRIFNFGSR